MIMQSLPPADLRGERKKSSMPWGLIRFPQGSAGSPSRDGASRLAPLGQSVEAAESPYRVAAHVALEHARLGVTQVHDHQAIQRIRKFWIYIESQQFSANLRVLL